MNVGMLRVEGGARSSNPVTALEADEVLAQESIDEGVFDELRRAGRRLRRIRIPALRLEPIAAHA